MCEAFWALRKGFLMKRTDEGTTNAVTVGDAAFALDAAAVVAGSIAICLAAQELVLMSVLIPALLVGRWVAFSRLPLAQRRLSVSQDVLLFAGCALVGGLNDWNSVVNHRIYDYQVPVFFPEWTSIPCWMLLFWGMILRFLITLFHWSLLGVHKISDTLWLGTWKVRSGWLRVAGVCVLAMGTRQFIYRYYLDPWLSWLPFLVALVFFCVLFRPGKAGLWLGLVFLVVGPVVEVLFIQLGGMHVYHLGWFWGVPLWIALWWVLAAALLREVSARLLYWLLFKPKMGLSALLSSSVNKALAFFLCQ